MTKYAAAIEFIQRAKKAYREDARRQTWEEKIAAVERMREADAACKEAMRKTLKGQK